MYACISKNAAVFKKETTTTTERENKMIFRSFPSSTVIIVVNVTPEKIFVLHFFARIDSHN